MTAVDERDKPSFVTTRWTIGEWMRAEDAPRTAPPHRSPNEAEVRLSTVWGDAAQTVPIAVQDRCGCQALISGPAGTEPE